MGNPLHGVPSSGGNIYPHMSNPYNVTFSSQEASSVMIPLQPFMNQLGGGYYPTGQGHGIYQNPGLACDLSKPVFLGSMGSTPQPRLPFLAMLNLPDLSKLMNDQCITIRHGPPSPPSFLLTFQSLKERMVKTWVIM
jgi:hypothetical protein